MASPTCRPDSSASLRPPQAPLDPHGDPHPLLGGDPWPGSTDLGAELRALVRLLDHVRGPVTRLLPSPAGRSALPDQIITDGRTVTIGCLADRSPATLTVLCADGGTFTMRVGRLEAAPDRPDPGWDEAGWAQADRFGPLPDQAVHAPPVPWLPPAPGCRSAIRRADRTPSESQPCGRPASAIRRRRCSRTGHPVINRMAGKTFRITLP